MKKFINNPLYVITDAIEGLELAHGDIVKCDTQYGIVKRCDAPVKGKVSIISGGGTGHEPLHSGYVGKGMLDAACCGEIFIPPSSEQIIAAAKAVNGGAGILFIVKNYMGDVVNFDKAAQLLKSEGLKVETVVIDDDVAVENSLYSSGRRGLGTTIIAEKICGAAAEKGYTLEQIAELCRKVKQNGRSIGMALTPCIVPAAGKPSFTLSENEIEIGIGIHGEPGRERMEIRSANKLIEMMANAILLDIKHRKADKFIAILNGMGGTPLIELYLLYNDLIKFTSSHNINIVRNLVGNYITSLEMQGFSITLVKADTEMLKLWNDPINTITLKW